MESRRGRTRTSDLSIIGRALYHLSYAPRTCDIGRVGFEPTIPRLKGGCLEPLGYRPALLTNSGRGTRTPIIFINNEAPYLSARPDRRGRGGGNRTRLWWTAYETAVPARAHPRTLTAAAGLEPAHTGLLDQRSVYPFELRRNEAVRELDGLGETRTHT